MSRPSPAGGPWPAGGLRGAIAFLTPLGGAARPGPGALGWFPMVGAAVGLGVGGVWWAGGQLWPAAVAAVLALVADLALTGMLHFDGLCDAADGLLPHLSRPRRLEVMARPDVGAYGVAVGGTVLLARWAALAALSPAPLLLGALWATSRTGMAATVLALPYARPGGLAQVFLGPGGGRSRLARVALSGTAVAVVLAVLWRPAVGPASVAAAALAGGGVVVLARRLLGGYTGDVLGAAGVIGETVGLLVAAAKW